MVFTAVSLKAHSTDWNLFWEYKNRGGLNK